VAVEIVPCAARLAPAIRLGMTVGWAFFAVVRTFQKVLGGNDRTEAVHQGVVQGAGGLWMFLLIFGQVFRAARQSTRNVALSRPFFWAPGIIAQVGLFHLGIFFYGIPIIW